jgi:hypothetical protein
VADRVAAGMKDTRPRGHMNSREYVGSSTGPTGLCFGSCGMPEGYDHEDI